MGKINYNGRRFCSVNNTGNGEVDQTTCFNYRQDGDVVWATYSGKSIIHGTLVAVADDQGNLDMRYQHVNKAGHLKTGTCNSKPEILPDGRIRLHEKWQWTCGDESTGESVIEELRK